MRPIHVVVGLVAAILGGLPVSGQAVISAHSGVVHFFEGSVFLDNHSIDRKFASFPSIPAGSTLRTEKGRAEVLLTPGVFLRMDEDSAIRMRSTSLADTQVDFLQGALIIDSLDALADNHVTLRYKDSEIRFPKQGVYRLDFDTGTVQAYSGEAEIAHDGKQSTLDDSHLFFLTLDLTTKKLDTGTEDEFYDWARDRSDAISAENQAAAQSSDDAADQGLDPNALGGVVPNYGVPNYGAPDPGLGGVIIPSTPWPDYSYGLGSPLYSPFGLYAAGYPFMPFMSYTAFPVYVLLRPYRGAHSRWPNRNSGGGTATSRDWWRTHPRPGWTRRPSTLTGAFSAPNGISRGARVQRLNLPLAHPMPSTVVRPMYARPAYARPAVPRPAYSRPAVASRPMAPVHPIGHR